MMIFRLRRRLRLLPRRTQQTAIQFAANSIPEASQVRGVRLRGVVVAVRQTRVTRSEQLQVNLGQ